MARVLIKNSENLINDIKFCEKINNFGQSFVEVELFTKNGNFISKSFQYFIKNYKKNFVNKFNIQAIKLSKA